MGSGPHLAFTVVASISAGTVSGILLRAATSKLQDPFSLLRTLRALGIGPPLAWPAVVAVIASEVAISTALIASIIPLVASAAAVLLFIGFGGVGVYAHGRGLIVPCNCFGSSSLNLGPYTAVRAAGLGIIALIVLTCLEVGASIYGPLALASGVLVAGGGWYVSWRRAGLPTGFVREA